MMKEFADNKMPKFSASSQEDMKSNLRNNTTKSTRFTQRPLNDGKSGFVMFLCCVSACIAGFFLLTDLVGTWRLLNGLAADAASPLAALVLVGSIFWFFVYKKNPQKRNLWIFVLSYIGGVCLSLVDPDHPEDIYAAILFVPVGLFALILDIKS